MIDFLLWVVVGAIAWLAIGTISFYMCSVTLDEDEIKEAVVCVEFSELIPV